MPRFAGFPSPRRWMRSIKILWKARRDTSGTSAGAGLQKAAPADAKKRQGYVWVQDGSFVKPVKVGIGPTDGAMTEVQGDEIKEGLEVITGEQRQAAAGDSASSPFAPTMAAAGE